MRGSVKVASLTKKITEKRVKWYGHVKRRDEEHVVRRVLDAPVPGKRWRGRHIRPGGKTRVYTILLKRCVKCVVNGGGCTAALDRTNWKNDIHDHYCDVG